MSHKTQAWRTIQRTKISFVVHNLFVSFIWLKQQNKQSPLTGLFVKTHTFSLHADTYWRLDPTQANKSWWWRHCVLFHPKNTKQTAISIWTLRYQNCNGWHSLWLAAVGWATTRCLEITRGENDSYSLGEERNVWLNSYETLYWRCNWCIIFCYVLCGVSWCEECSSVAFWQKFESYLKLN